MKKTISLILCLMITVAASAQITYEANHNNVQYGGFSTFSASGDKYYTVTESGQVTLYNMDNSVWKTFGLVITPGWGFYGDFFFSDHLANSDDLVEVFYNTSSMSGGGTPHTRICNENGALVFDTIGGVWQLRQTSAGYKLMLNKGYYPSQYFSVYSLPGSVPCKECFSFPVDVHNYNTESKLSVSPPVPNPTNAVVRIGVSIPSSTKNVSLVLYNIDGKEILRQVVLENSDHIDLQLHNIPSGNYLYQLVSSLGYSNTYQLSVQH